MWQTSSLFPSLPNSFPFQNSRLHSKAEVQLAAPNQTLCNVTWGSVRPVGFCVIFYPASRSGSRSEKASCLNRVLPTKSPRPIGVKGHGRLCFTPFPFYAQRFILPPRQRNKPHTSSLCHNCCSHFKKSKSLQSFSKWLFLFYWENYKKCTVQS